METENNLVIEFNKRFAAGDLVQHFKRELLPPERQSGPEYLYIIKCVAFHSETGEPLVIYKALYDNWHIYARPMKMFLSEVDKEKYSTIKQTFRFEKLSSNYGSIF